MNSVCGVRSLSLSELNLPTFVNEGQIAEQFIAQHLFFSGRANVAPELHYWIREGRKGNAEVDFVIVRENRIAPVEVKAGKQGALKSLHQFMHEKGLARAFRFDLNRPGTQRAITRITLPSGASGEVDYELTSFPLYMVGRFSERQS